MWDLVCLHFVFGHMKTKHVKNLLAQQRDRHIIICKKRKALYVVLKNMRITSENAIKLLGDIQNASEEFVSIGAMVCSKVQHAVTVCDPGSLAVAGSVVAVDVATASVERADADQYVLQDMVTTMQEVCQGIVKNQGVLCDDLSVMHTAHICAADVHSQALFAIEQGVGQEPETGLLCAVCGRDAEPVYAARTGTCKTCHDAAGDVSNTGWLRCVDPLDAMQDARSV
jgi:thiamine phosphate synthase YjbQ (UPF0047 family)